MNGVCRIVEEQHPVIGLKWSVIILEDGYEVRTFFAADNHTIESVICWAQANGYVDQEVAPISWPFVYEGKSYHLSDKQLAALENLASAYRGLSDVWASEWEGPDNFGVVLDRLGVLPPAGLYDAAGEIETLLIEITNDEEDDKEVRARCWAIEIEEQPI